MRKLIAFLRRFRVFLVFVMLQLIALGSYFSYMTFPRTKFFNTSNRVTGTLLSWERDVSKYFYLDEANRELMDENALLAKKVPKNFISVDPKTSIIRDTINELSFVRIPATVINSSFSRKNNYFTINAGSKKGIKKKMGVISPEGVVGIVYDVSSHFAVVQSILTTTVNLSAYVEGSNAHGLIKYLEDDPRRVSLTGLSNDIKISKGAIVLARGSAGYFPHGEEIGVVENLEPIEGKPMWNITVRLSQDMRKLRYVYVIKNIFQEELDQLQDKIDGL